MKLAQYCTILVKVDVLNTCGAMMCSYFGIAFPLFLIKIENTVCTSFRNSTRLFINGLIFDIMNSHNIITILLNLNEYQYYHHLHLSMIEDFHGFVMFFLSLSKIGWILFSKGNFTNAKETLQKMLARKCSYRGKHMKDWK